MDTRDSCSYLFLFCSTTSAILTIVMSLWLPEKKTLISVLRYRNGLQGGMCIGIRILLLLCYGRGAKGA